MSAPRVVLHRFAEVRAALRCADLAAPGVTVPHDQSHRVVRHSVREQASTASLLALRDPFVSQLCMLLAAPRTSSPWCFVANVAVPWAFAVTGQLMHLTPACVQGGAALAAHLFESAAHSANGDSTPEALAAAGALYQMLTRDARLRSAHGAANAAAVQTFVALTQSLPALLASAMHALLLHTEQYTWLRGHHHTTLAAAAHELLRFATPTRAVYRRALRDTVVGEHTIATNTLIVLQLAAANRDPAHFTNPDTLQLAAGRAGHVSFGGGPHQCSGAMLVHTLLDCALEALATSPVALALAGPVSWLDGVALSAPTQLTVTASR
ncbi:cytochrome P450 [Gemmatimonas sp.]